MMTPIVLCCMESYDVWSSTSWALGAGVLTLQCGPPAAGAGAVVGSIAAALSHATVTRGAEIFTVQLAELHADLVRVPKRDDATAAAADTAAAAASGCAAEDLKCGDANGGAVCPLGMTCREAACVPTAHDAGGTLASLLGDVAFSENFGGACVAPRCSAAQCG